MCPEHQMVQQSFKHKGIFASSDAKHRCTASAVSAKMVLISCAHAGQLATKAALLR